MGEVKSSVGRALKRKLRHGESRELDENDRGLFFLEAEPETKAVCRQFISEMAGNQNEEQGS